MHVLKELFPTSAISHISTHNPDTVSLQLATDQWLIIPKDDITPRELALIDHLKSFLETPQTSTNPLYHYLLHNTKKIDLPMKNIQFIHFYIHQHTYNEKELYATIQSLFTHVYTHFKIAPNYFIFAINQDVFFDTHAVISEMLPTLEVDFSIKLSTLVGKLWNYSEFSQLPLLFQAERDLFQKHVTHTHHNGCLRFSTLLLLSHQYESSSRTLFYQQLKKYIQLHEDIAPIILTLWKEQAVLTRTAQELYIHRNTLMYRLDKFQEQTGLSLKNMDDLTLCYLSLIAD